MSKEIKALFVHDHVFRVNDKDEVFSTGGLPSSVWERYLRHFSKLTVAARCHGKIIGKTEQEKLVLSSHDDVSFNFCHSASDVRSLITNGGVARHEIAKAVSEHDVIIARLSSELGLIAIDEAKKIGKVYAIELVECPWDSYWNYGNFSAKLYSPIISFKIRKAISESPFVLYVTKEFLQNRYPCKNGITVDCSNVEISNTQDVILSSRLKKIESRKSKIVFAQIASLTGKFKGIQVALEAVAKVKDVLPNIEYRVLGSGDKSPWVQEAKRLGINDICFFDGSLTSGTQVFDWLDKADIYIHPSYKEGLPRALIEAMSRACPSIATDVAGIPELLPQEMMVNPGNSEKLAQKMITLANDEVLQITESKRNFDIAKRYSKYTLDSKRSSFWHEVVKAVD